MWFTAVCSKAWLLLWNTGSSLSLREEDSSLGSGSTRLRQLLHGMGSISHRFTMPTDHWRTDLMPDGMVERTTPWAKDQVELSNLVFEIGCRLISFKPPGGGGIDSVGLYRLWANRAAGVRHPARSFVATITASNVAELRMEFATA